MFTLASLIEIGKGAYETLLYTGVSFFLSFILAHIIAIYNSLYDNTARHPERAKEGISWILRLKRTTGWMLSKFFKLYVSIFRGTPVLVQLFIVYYALPQVFNIHINPFISVVIALSLNSAAYLSEILRAGIQNIDKGQFEAAQVLGIPKFLMWRDIIWKQMFIMTLPNIFNEFINLLKETAVISMVGGNDILKRASNIGAQTYSYMEPYLIAALYYYVLIFALTQISRHIEKKVAL